jgi:muramidase (phage lysozyme)
VISLNYASLLQSQNVRAFSRVVREGESSQTEDAYRMRYGGWNPDTRRYNPVAYFDDFSAHPRVMELTPTGEYSSAAGAYQHTYTTWSTVCMDKYGLGPDFKPYTQDCAFVALLHNRGALEDVVDGRFDEALRKCRNEWASLPGSTLDDGGSKVAYDRARAVYSAWGGSFAEDIYVIRPEPAPIEERSVPAQPEDIERINQEGAPMGALAFILPLLQSLFTVFEPLAKAKLNDALAKQVKDPVMSLQMATEMMSIVKQAAGMTGVIPAANPADTTVVQDAAIRQAEEIAQAAQAVQVVKADATLVQEVEANMLDYLDRIAPMIDRIDVLEQKAWAASEASMNAAAQRAADDPNAWDARKVLIGSSVIGVAIVVLFVCGILAVQVYRGIEVGVEIWAALTGLIGWVTAKAGTLWDYYFGSSRTSSAKDTAIAELSARRPAR